MRENNGSTFLSMHLFVNKTLIFRQRMIKTSQGVDNLLLTICSQSYRRFYRCQQKEGVLLNLFSMRDSQTNSAFGWYWRSAVVTI